MLASTSVYGAEPERDFASIVKAFYAKSSHTDWRGLETLPGIQWAPLPPTMLENCLEDGGCFTRRGEVRISGRSFTAMATGARTIVTNLYLSSPGSNRALEILKAIRSLGLSAGVVRCPVLEPACGANWYRLTGPGIRTGILSIRAVCEGQSCESYVLSQGDELPPLPPADLKFYSEQCAAPPAERLPIATVTPIDRLAQILATLISPSGGGVLRDWTALHAASTQIVWNSTTPQKMDLTFENDANPFAQTATLSLPGRKFSVLASGLPAQPKTIHIDETGMHPRGEHLLGALYTQGFSVQLVRCGPIYTQSTNNWYSVTSSATHPVMLRQSIW